MTKTYSILLLLAVLVIAIAAIGLLIWDFVFAGNHKSILVLTAFAIGVLVFFGSMRIETYQASLKSNQEYSLRKPIAITLIVMYLFMMSTQMIIAFGDGELSGGASAFTQSFTTIIGIVIAFYFGASAAVEIAALRGRSKTESEEKGEV